jgi:hypothetical protein
MNFLELVQEVDKLALIKGQIDSVNPTGGFQQAMVGAVQRANHDIHMMRKDWLFNHSIIQIPLSVATSSYTPTTVRYWEEVYYDNSSLKQWTYPAYLEQNWAGEGGKAPYKYTKAPDKSLIFNPSDKAYIVNAHAYLLPDELSTVVDIPRIPLEYHYLIVYKALIILGSSIALGNVISEYTMAYNEMLGQMMRDYVPSRHTQRRPLV